MPTTRRTPKTLHLDGLPTIYPNAAAMDIGADEIVVAVPADLRKCHGLRVGEYGRFEGRELRRLALLPGVARRA